MKQLRGNLKKQDIALSNGYMKWYRIIDGKLRVFINENHVNHNNELLNKIYWRENRGEICINVPEYCEKFYKAHKALELEFFVKNNVSSLYFQYEVKDWSLKDNYIEVIFTK
ncbi:hypothetical protein FDB55_11165 [Clostridium botulinum]|uniref:Uncharacterized protein n=1 Tax=Clostridium botulinum TaxID=1491 RepID=A0A0M1M6X8_CLOBO|nr:hypothetical protein [Clostridium botulinum]KAI3345641.1 hypothetical protein CIT18_15620 [Clostridium botulinum]KOM89640.1 hypothetical protein ACP51_00820 [Clostridium botulinum]KOR65619.1 hypothetical protein ADT22_00455 [Clostridium botulinum]MBN1049291.1 hypothetical protein [Clostridium botulinum]MCS6110233.1 hypothetical protein [Clostridium botulinum]